MVGSNPVADQCGALEAPVVTTVRAWGAAHRVGGMDRDVDKPGEASNRS
jgi:hypothetical protein